MKIGARKVSPGSSPHKGPDPRRYHLKYQKRVSKKTLAKRVSKKTLAKIVLCLMTRRTLLARK